MIENVNANGLTGQMELGDVMGEAIGETTSSGHAGDQEIAPTAEGYDAEGHLINPGNMPEMTEGTTGGISSAPDGAPSPEGKAFGEGAGEDVPAALAADRLGVLAAEIHAITEQTRGVVIGAALQIGKRLIEAKGLVPSGRWLEWLEANVDYSERRAQDLMRLYEEYGRGDELPDAIARLDYSKAVALLAAPEDAREALAEKVTDEGLSVRQLNEEIRRLRAENEGQQQRLDDLIEMKRQDNEQIETLGTRYDAAVEEIRERTINAENAIRREREAAKLAEAKATAAEASAQALRKLHSDAEDRAAQSAQRAIDAVNRANRTAKELAEARARIAELEAAGRTTSSENAGDQGIAPTGEGPGEVVERIVEVVPEDVKRELDELRRQLAEERAKITGNTSSDPSGHLPLKGKAFGEAGGEGSGASAVEKFRWFYANQMKPAFSTALVLLREVAQEDGHAANMFATALTKGCQQLMNQLGAEG